MIVSGFDIATKIKNNLKQEIDCLMIKPKLAVVLIGENPASITYVNAKQKACASVGIGFELIKLNADVSEAKILEIIERLNQDSEVDGILVQLPLPKHINTRKVLNHISIKKDVDGLNIINAGNLFIGDNALFPCTPLGIMEIFKSLNYDLSGKNVCVVGRSNLVGLPLSMLLLKANATVTICHSKTQDLASITRKSDVLIVAIGQARFIDDNYVDHQDLVIDVGINRDDFGICGDVDFIKVKDKVKMITPVPKGVGPLTIASLLSNTLKAYKVRRYE